MNILVIKLADGRTIRHQRVDGNYDDVNLDQIVERYAQTTNTEISAVVSSAVTDKANVSLPGLDLATDITIVNGAVIVDTIAAARRAGIMTTDKKTGDAIDAGFTHGGKLFSLSLTAQISLNGLANQRASDGTYP